LCPKESGGSGGAGDAYISRIDSSSSYPFYYLFFYYTDTEIFLSLSVHGLGLNLLPEPHPVQFSVIISPVHVKSKYL
jgi:hypothetical protein